MVRQDILGGLKNAIEHGSSIEQAKKSFINSGYSPDEVEEAAKYINVKDFRIVSPPPRDDSAQTSLVSQQSIKQLSQKIQQSPQTSATSQTQIPSAQPLPTTQPIQPQQILTTQSQPPQKKSSVFLWIMVIILFLLVIGGAFILYFLGVFSIFFPPATPDALPFP